MALLSLNYLKKSEDLQRQHTEHIMQVLFTSKTSVRNIFLSHKYLVSYATKKTHKHIHESSYKVKKFSALNRSTSFITVCIKAQYSSLTKPDEYSPCHPITLHISLRSMLILSSINAQVFQVVLFLQVTSPKHCTHLFLPTLSHKFSITY